MVLISILAVYTYRDVWPLMTFTLRPCDEAEGSILWTKIALLGLAGVVLPLFEPYPYIPWNTKASIYSLWESLRHALFRSQLRIQEPFLLPHPEQTASIFTFLTYTFMDPTIIKASRQAHLGFDDLPPLCDYDAAKNLIKQAYPVSSGGF